MGSKKYIEIDYIKKELDFIKGRVFSKKEPWFINIPIIISVGAFILSLGTTFISYIHTKEQNIQNSKRELRILLQRTSSIARENYELFLNNNSNIKIAMSISGYIRLENALLLGQAIDIINSIPEKRVTAIEYCSLGEALVNAENRRDGLEYIKKALYVANDFTSEITALRSYASLLYNIGNIREGRKQYSTALNIFSKYGKYNEFQKMETQIYTELNWAQSEAYINNYSVALDHINML